MYEFYLSSIKIKNQFLTSSPQFNFFRKVLTKLYPSNFISLAEKPSFLICNFNPDFIVLDLESNETIK